MSNSDASNHSKFKGQVLSPTSCFEAAKATHSQPGYQPKLRFGAEKTTPFASGAIFGRTNEMPLPGSAEVVSSKKT